jgi:superfamily II DNA or RNA helicase
MFTATPGASRWRAGARLTVRGRRWRVDAVTSGANCASLQLTEIGGAPPSTLAILTPFDRPVAIDRAVAISVVKPRRWLHDLDRILVGVHPFGSLLATARTPIALMPYQLEPALAMLRFGACRLLVADAVGLGKTIQAGVILLELGARGDASRALVLVPAGLRDQWAHELATHFGIATTSADAAWLRRTVSERPVDVNPWSLPGTYIASHDFVKRPEALRPLEDVSWDVVVVDEAHLAASGTDRRAAIHAIASRALRVVLLTATPHSDDPREFASLCRIGRATTAEPAPLLFARTKASVDGARERKTLVLPVAPSDAEARMHGLLERYSTMVWKEAAARNDERARLASIVLRKRALSSAGSLAVSVQRRMELLLSDPGSDAEQLTLPLAEEDPLGDDAPSEALRAPGLADPRREKRWLGAIAEAAKVAARAETKTRYLLRLLDRIHEPVIVFTEYRDTLRRLHRQIAATGRSIAVLHGGLTPAERSQVPRVFAGGLQTLLATDAAAEGLNLHHRCRLVVHYELPWNPARMEQRAGRVDRIGQVRQVHEVALVAASTAERLVLAPLLQRSSRQTSGLERWRMLAALTESRVADAVMSDTPIRLSHAGLPPIQTVEAVPADFRREAVQEAERLSHHRRLMARSGPGVSLPRDVISTWSPARRSAGRSRLDLLYAIGLETGDGRRVHTETVAASIEMSLQVPRSGWRARLRELVGPYVKPFDEQLLALLTRALKRSLDDVARLAAIPGESLRNRQESLNELRRSAARELAQPRLFGRRRATAADPDPGSIEHRNTVDAIDTPLRADVMLIAAILRSGRTSTR